MFANNRPTFRNIRSLRASWQTSHAHSHSAEVTAMSTDAANPASPAKSDIPHEVVVTCPATGQFVGRVPVATSVEVEAVAARLRAAQPAWQRLGVKGRARWLGQWRDWLLDHTDDLLTVLQLETGKSWGDANVEIAAVQGVNYWIDKAAH